MIALGIDPDTHDMGVACVHWDGPQRPPNQTRAANLLHFARVQVPDNTKGAAAVLEMVRQFARAELGDWPEPDLLVVEGQQIYKGKTPNPGSILMIGQVAGACLMLPHICSWWQLPRGVLFPYPQDWKGSVPKGAHQKRIAERWFGSTVDSFPSSHVLDAAGLARWGIAKRLLR